MPRMQQAKIKRIVAYAENFINLAKTFKRDFIEGEISHITF